MLISTETGSFCRFGDRMTVLKMLRDADFTAFDVTMDDGHYDDILCSDDYLSGAKVLRKAVDELGLVCNQVHAPAPSMIPGNDRYNKENFQKLIRAIEVGGILGAKICVVHPVNDYSAGENAEFYLRLEPHARNAGIGIALENMYNGMGEERGFRAVRAACSDHADFKRHLDLLPEDVFSACVDIGHAEMGGLGTSAEKMIRTLGRRVRAIHLHDNDLVHDCHMLPFTMKIPYRPIIRALKEIGYKGDVTLEAYSFIGGFPPELVPRAMKLMAETAEYFRRELESPGKLLPEEESK